jgi:hypothetical protein
MEFRTLRADEIDCRVSICNEYGVGLLLYKDARCDQNILDETVGAMNWQRHHSRDNANCIVSIWDKEKQQWIEKEDTGKESNTEAEKGLASDSFKRACFNWGIGRELYTAPNMFVLKKDLKTHKEEDWNGKKKWTCRDTFTVLEIEYLEGKIVYVKVLNTKNNNEIEFGQPANAQTEQKKIENSVIDEVKLKSLLARCEKEGVYPEKLQGLYKINSLADLTEKQFRHISDNWEKLKKV